MPGCRRRITVNEMNRLRLLRHSTDTAMTLVLLGLMSFSTTGQAVHEWMGVVTLLLCILHHVWNWKWFAALGRGRYTPARILQTVFALLLLVSILAQMVSGIAMSRYALSFLDIPVPISSVRLIHLACGYWTWIFTGLHLGLHWGIFLGLGRKAMRGKSLPAAGQWVIRLLAVAFAGWGAYVFFSQHIPDYLFLRTQFAFFDYDVPVILVVAELLAQLWVWTVVGYRFYKLAQSLPRAISYE